MELLTASASVQLVAIDITGRGWLFEASRCRWLRGLEAVVHAAEAIGRHILAAREPRHVDLCDRLSKVAPSNSVSLGLAGELSHLSHHLRVDHLLLVSLHTGHG